MRGSVILVNERVTRQEEEQLIDHPSISKSQQLEPNGMPATNSGKSEKSQVTQSFIGTHQYTQ